MNEGIVIHGRLILFSQIRWIKCNGNYVRAKPPRFIATYNNTGGMGSELINGS